MNKTEIEICETMIIIVISFDINNVIVHCAWVVSMMEKKIFLILLRGFKGHLAFFPYFLTRLSVFLLLCKKRIPCYRMFYHFFIAAQYMS